MAFTDFEKDLTK